MRLVDCVPPTILVRMSHRNRQGNRLLRHIGDSFKVLTELADHFTHLIVFITKLRSQTLLIDSEQRTKLLPSDVLVWLGLGLQRLRPVDLFGELLLHLFVLLKHPLVVLVQA